MPSFPRCPIFLCAATLLLIALALGVTACGVDDNRLHLVGRPDLKFLGDYPRPDRVRQGVTLLAGGWNFAFDPGDVGLTEQWQLAPKFPKTIEVPFCVESEASGIQDTDPPSVVWYSRVFSYDVNGRRQTLLHFGAVDYHAMVWLNGIFLGEHSGGYTPFSFAVGNLLQAENTLVVRVEDGLSLTRPRGKQSRTGKPFEVFYETVTGIWQPVWLENTGPVYLQSFRVVPDLSTGRVEIRADIAGIDGSVSVEAIAVSPNGERAVAETTSCKVEPVETVQLTLGFYSLLPWSPDEPNLYSLRLTICAGDEKDVVDSYFGARSIETIDGHVFLNGQRFYQRLTLNQGYFAHGHYTPVDPEGYRRDIELVKEYGFNGLRMHEKIESPQFLFWADFLGAVVWEEMPTAWRFCDEQNENLEREWREAIKRDINHPSIITWVDFNEAWGLGIFITPEISVPAVLFPRRIEFEKHMVEVARELDPSRLVIDNSGWDHTTATDVVDIHHYLPTLERAAELYEELEDLYSYRWTLWRLLEPGINNNIFTFGEGYRGQPIIISEYGGFGYYNPGNAENLAESYRAYTEQIKAQPHICGYCYTQFNDTYQERNGLVDMERNPNVSADEIRAINEF